MRVEVFHVGDGDCLLLSSTRTDRNGNEVEYRILADGGRKQPFRDHAREEIYGLDALDLVYVSHIDDDHISGILGMIEDLVVWRVHHHRHARGEPSPRPSFPEPPRIKEIWHNSLFELVGDELEPRIEASLAATAATFANATLPALSDLAASCQNLATGERSSMELSRRISTRQLDIARNRPRNELMHTESSRYRRIGPFTIRIIGPQQSALEALRLRWEKWLTENGDMLKRLQAEILDDEERLSAAEASTRSTPGISTALGDGTITEPNLASLMLLVQDQAGPTVLLTGDGSSEDILAGLRHHGKLDDDDRIHVDLLKVQHHAAEANVTREFVERVTADHYVFCGNGAHHNPEKTVVAALAEARLGVDRDQALGPASDFTFWFSSSKDTPGLQGRRVAHMTEIENLVESIAADHDREGRFHRRFLRQRPLVIDL
ncbi:MAG: hypothetical protein OES24_23075 [Acidimicrobiia bacterium]|nr:hypothetical protein [Acidimicrobiia bacterium]